MNHVEVLGKGRWVLRDFLQAIQGACDDADAVLTKTHHEMERRRYVLAMAYIMEYARISIVYSDLPYHP